MNWIKYSTATVRAPVLPLPAYVLATAYNPILDKPGSWGAAVFTDPTPRGITFEGFYEWMVHSQAYAENEWKNAQPWNTPRSLTLAPGESKTYGLKFLVSDSIRNIETTLC